MTDRRKQTDQEINEAVAVKLGWEHVPAAGGSDDYWRRDALRDEKGRVVRPADFPFVPDYVHSIQAVWEVVEHVKSKGLLFQLDDHQDKENELWTAEIINKQIEIESDASADTAPMAICLAFLKL